MNEFLVDVSNYVIDKIGALQQMHLAGILKGVGGKNSFSHISEVNAFDSKFICSLGVKAKLAMTRDEPVSHIDMSKFKNVIRYNNCYFVRLIIFYDILNDPGIFIKNGEMYNAHKKALQINNALEEIDKKAGVDESESEALWYRIYERFIIKYETQFYNDMETGESFSLAYSRMESGISELIDKEYSQYAEFTERMMCLTARTTTIGCSHSVKSFSWQVINI